MQIKIHFKCEQNIILPIHYNAMIQGFIYHHIDEKLGEFLHDQGFISMGRSFKLFSFSRILNKGRRVNDDFNFGQEIAMIISSPLEVFCQSIANHMLLDKDLSLGTNHLKLDKVVINNPSVEGDEVTVTTNSPIVAYSTLFKQDGKKFTYYFTPYENNFKRIVGENLIRKYNAFTQKELPLTEGIIIDPIGQFSQNAVLYKKVIIKGVSGVFKLKGRQELLQMAIDCGLGSKNSQGFGCITLK